MAHATGGPPMPTDALPEAWPNLVRSAVLQVVSLAHFAITSGRGWTANVKGNASQSSVTLAN